MNLEPIFKRSLLKDNFQQSIKKLLTIGQLFGVIPWSVDLYEKNVLWRGSCLQKLVRVVNVVYSVAIILAVCIATGFHYTEFISSDVFAIRTLSISEDITVNVIVMLALIRCQFLRSFFAKLTTELVTVLDNLSGSGGTIDFHRIETIVRRALFGMLLYFGAILTFDYLNGLAWPHRFIYRTVLYTLPNVINVLALYQYVVLLWFTCQCYRATNKLLKMLIWSATSPDRLQMTANSRRGYQDSIETLRRTHLKISNLTCQVNDGFGPLIVCTMLSSFVVLSLQLFGIYKIMTAMSWSNRDYINLLYTLLWIGLHVVKVLLVLYSCHLVQRERDRTGPVLYSFNQSFADSSIHTVLAKFSSQLLHEKGSHTACGLIILDMTLISTMVGALTTYLVILIQFDSAFVKDANITVSS